MYPNDCNCDCNPVGKIMIMIIIMIISGSIKVCRMMDRIRRRGKSLLVLLLLLPTTSVPLKNGEDILEGSR